MKKNTTAISRLLFFMILLAATASFAQTVRYVKTTAAGTGNGSSWADASSDIQAMINASSAGDQVWVAAGIYKPSRPATNLNDVSTPNNRNNVFALKEGVKVYGGFQATGNPVWADRDWENYVTTLSGDIGSAGIAADNAFHVVLAAGQYEAPLSSDTILDGFNILSGNANGAGDQEYITIGNIFVYQNAGGAIYTAYSNAAFSSILINSNNAITGGGFYSTNATPTLTNIRCMDNTATEGGGIYLTYSSIVLNNVQLEENTATNGGGFFVGSYVDQIIFNNVLLDANSAVKGGGIYNQSASEQIFNNVLIANNTAVDGGGIYNYYVSNIFIEGVAITGNTATNNGGGVYNHNVQNSSQTYNNGINFKDVALAGNMAINGAGMYNNLSIVGLDDVTIQENTASGNGGGIYNVSSGPTLLHSTISGNTALNGGGIYSTGASYPILLMSTLVSGNKAINQGGAIYNSNNTMSLQLMNATISGNNAIAGGAIYNSGATPSIVNSVIYGNSSGVVNTSSVPVYSHSLVQGLTATTNGNISGNSNPLFVDPASFTAAPSTTGDYRIKLASPLVNTGDTNLYIEMNDNNLSDDKDIDGNFRVYNFDDGIPIDIGAYEHTITPDAGGVLYVREGATGNGGSWADASGDLQAMIDAKDVQQIWVGAGVYKPIRSSNQRHLITPDNRNNTFLINKIVKIYGGFPAGNPSFNDRDWHTNASVLSGDLGVAGNIADNCYNVIVTLGWWVDNRLSAEAEVNGFTITGGNANGSMFWNGNEYISQMNGGGIQNLYSDCTYQNIIVSNNSSIYGGGGIYNLHSSPAIKNSSIKGNISLDTGGAMYNNGLSAALLTNVQITGNMANGAGGIFNFTSSPVLTNVTISGNAGAAIVDYQVSGTVLHNTIIAGNEYDNAGVGNVSNSFVQGVSTNDNNGNIDGTLSPLFTNAPSYTTAPFTGGDYTLQSNSPLADAGSNTLYLNDGGNLSMDRDLAGQYRIYDYANGGVIDLGAYERNACMTALPVVMPITICGSSTVSDLTASGSALQWYATATGGAALASATPLQAGTYYVSQTVDDCESPRLPVAVGLNTVPVPTAPQLQQIGDNLPANATIADLDATGTNIKWYSSEEDLGNGNALSPADPITVFGTYYVTQTVDGCESLPLMVQVTIILGTAEFDSRHLKYYPNPATNELHVDYAEPINTIAVYSVTGQEIISESWNDRHGVLDFSSVAQGSYIVKLTSGESSKSFLIIKN